MKGTILVPTDFSEVCNNAVNHACDLAKFLNLKVIVLHVITKETKSYLNKQKLTMEGLEKQLSDYAEQKKSEYQIEVETILSEGSIFTEIDKVSTEQESALIILGTHGKIGFQKLTGSYAMKVVNNTTIPTVIVQKKPLSGAYKNIVFPISPYAHDRKKVNIAMAIAKSFDATIHLIPKYETDKYASKKIIGIVKQVQNIFDEHGVNYCKNLPSEGAGNFSKQVIDYAVINKADLIVIVTSSGGSLPMFDSSDEQIVFNSSQIPVMCVDPGRLNFSSRAGSNWSVF